MNRSKHEQRLDLEIQTRRPPSFAKMDFYGGQALTSEVTT